MASEERFVYNPTQIDNIPRSKFPMNNKWIGSMYHGDLVPIEITRVMPGDSFRYQVDGFIRTATPPIAPFFGDIYCNVAAFFVPDRLVWDKTKEFYGENREGYGIQTEILQPRDTSGNQIETYDHAVANNGLAKYLGLVKFGTGNKKDSPIALNPIRSFLQVYNDWFRNENFDSPYLWDHNQTGDGSKTLATIGGANYNAASGDLPVVCKKLDRFTSCLPWAQKGQPVIIGLGDTAPIVGLSNVNVNISADDDGDYYAPLNVMQIDDPDNTANLVSDNDAASITEGVIGYLNDSSQREIVDSKGLAYHSGLKAWMSNTNKAYVDLSAATAATVNELRFAFATQRYLEALARGGSKYREWIKSIFGVSIGDTTAQMAEYLGGITMRVNVDQVLQTTGFSAGQSTELGTPGAVSVSACSEYLFTKSFAEPGYIVLVAYTKHSRMYGQGIDEIFKKHELLEEYNPKFAFIGEQGLKSNTLYFDGDKEHDNDVFGFQEAWSEYRHKKDVCIDALNPALTGALNYWNLAENFSTKPQLNSQFLKEDRSCISRVLAGGTNGPDYFANFSINRIAVRPMPLYSVPGLIDHH